MRTEKGLRVPLFSSGMEYATSLRCEAMTAHENEINMDSFAVFSSFFVTEMDKLVLKMLNHPQKVRLVAHLSGVDKRTNNTYSMMIMMMMMMMVMVMVMMVMMMMMMMVVVMMMMMVMMVMMMMMMMMMVMMVMVMMVMMMVMMMMVMMMMVMMMMMMMMPTFIPHNSINLNAQCSEGFGGRGREGNREKVIII